MIDVQTNTITADFGYIVNANTLFYIKNDGNASDYSNYHHTMNRYGNKKMYTLSNGRQVAHFDGTNAVYSDQFHEADGKTTFTLHIRRKLIQPYNGDSVLGGRAGRNSDPTSDRRGIRFQQATSTAVDSFSILYGISGSSRGTVPSSVSFQAGTSSFVLFSITASGNNFKIYKNGQKIFEFTGNTLRGGSSTGPRFQLGKSFHYNGSLWTNGPTCYMGESVLEDKTETDAEVLSFYNKTKNHYV